MTKPKTTGPGWGNICRDCFGSKVEWPGIRMCKCTSGKVVLPADGWWRTDKLERNDDAR